MMKNIKTFQVTEERLKENAGAGLNKVVCVVVVLILIVLLCIGGFYWYKCSKNKELNPLEQSGGKIESGEIGGNLSSNELMSMGLQLGDYVSYTADVDTRSANWRVWKIEGDNIIIVPTEPLGDLTLGVEDWLNAEEKIENECDKYINSSLGITAEDIRSMKIEDIEKALLDKEVEKLKLLIYYGREYSYESGMFYAEKANVDTFDGYNKELSTPKTASPSNPVKIVNTPLDYNDIFSSINSWYKLKNTKIGMTHDTYGTILGNSWGWLASRYVDCHSSFALFDVCIVYGGNVSGSTLYNSSVGAPNGSSYGVRPLVFLDSKLFNGAGEGTESKPWQLGKKIKNEEIEGTNGITGEISSDNELVAMGLQVGDYVSYAADINVDVDVDWRVWKIEEENVIIVPTAPLGNLILEGPEDWLNAEEKIENECDKYINSSLGITVEDIRSMKIEDIEEVMPAEDLESVKLDDDYGKEYNYESGIFYAEKTNADTFDGYNNELSTPKTASSSSPVKLVKTYWSDGPSSTWNKVNNTKVGMELDIYGDILGEPYDWLASRCVHCYSSGAYFSVRSMENGYFGSGYGYVFETDLYNSEGHTYSHSRGVRPLVFLDSKLFNGAGEGTESKPWQLGEKIENEEIEGTNGVTDENSLDNELVEMGLQVGDYVSYTADIDTNIDWRVWKIEEDNVIIVPTHPLGDLTLEGAEGWLNAEEKIENECDKYINNDLGVTVEDIRSMKIEDIEEVLPEKEVKNKKSQYGYGIEDSETIGTYYAEKANAGTFDGYNKELSTPKIADSSRPVKLVSTKWCKNNPTWNKLNNTKAGMGLNTYGDILGNTYGWLGSRCVSANFPPYFEVHNVSSGGVYHNTLCEPNDYGYTYSYNLGVRPLITLSSKLFNGEGEGTESDPWQLVENL